MSGYIIASAIIALLFVLIGLVVYFRNAVNLSNRFFLIFSISTAAWLVANYLGSSPDTGARSALYANHLVLAFAGASVLALLLFTLNFFKYVLVYRRPLVAISLISIIGTLTPYTVQSVTNTGQTYAIQFGWFAALYFAALVINFLHIIVVLALIRRRAIGLKKSQANAVLLSFAVSLTALMITNAFIPLTLNIYRYTGIGSFFSAIIVGGIAYTMIRHKLFDIKLVVARSLGYAFSIALLTSAYALITYLFSTVVFQNFGGQSRYSGLVNIIVLLIASISYAPVKRFFDRITNSLFYKDAYDSQKLLNAINAIILSNTDVDTLLARTSATINEYIRASHVLIYLRATDYSPTRVRGERSKLVDIKKLEIFISKATRNNKKLIIADDLQEDFPDLFAAFSENEIGLLSPLTQRLARRSQNNGYLILGSKKSGNPFSKQDIEVLNVITAELTIALQNALRFEEIQNFNLTLKARVDEQTRKLRRTNEKLKQLDETKDDFISMASHQLRTPLTSIKGYLSMVLEEDAGKVTPTQREMLGQAFFSSQRMVYLIADLLNVSRLRTGKFIIEPAPVNLAEVVEQEMTQLRETAAVRGHTLSYEKPKNFPTVMLDETKTRQVIMNFTDNAIYYTPNGGHITVRLVDLPGAIELRVEDNGLGVPKAEQPHLFTKFYRASNARQARPDGTGLGLFMAKKVIVAQGGSLIFDSKEGQGSTFGFVFSKDKVAGK